MRPVWFCRGFSELFGRGTGLLSLNSSSKVGFWQVLGRIVVKDVMDGGSDNLGERFSFTQDCFDNSEGSGLWVDSRASWGAWK